MELAGLEETADLVAILNGVVTLVGACGKLDPFLLDLNICVLDNQRVIRLLVVGYCSRLIQVKIHPIFTLNLSVYH